ncbi:MAG: hypothetical protein EBZ77_17165, partial [Chitinophagia bacterium]|nr:hypothetical protein [Chitinophagia bacterium]
QGNVTAFDFINLIATGNSGISGSGNITNGFATTALSESLGIISEDNSNVFLAAKTYINLVAKNNINNYGTILGTTNTNLTAINGNINNYLTGKITGGSGVATINALSGAFNNTSQNSVFTSNHNAIFNVKDLNNNGEISVANDLAANITNSLTNNPTALIWSGNNATFNVANTFLNNQADIYANNNLTIQKNTSSDSSQNKTNLVQNISGNIETYSGDILIRAATLNNIRSEYRYVENKTVPGFQRTDSPDFSSLVRNVVGNVVAQGKIFSGNNLNIFASQLHNKASSILATKNMFLNANEINNESLTLYATKAAGAGGGKGYCPGTSYLVSLCYGGGTWLYRAVMVNSGYQEQYPAYIKAGGALTITQNGAVNSSLING